MENVRGTHSSPGTYSQINDLSVAAKTLGVTSLGIAGETLKGPAFEPILVSDYGEFQTYFGGCSAEKFKDSQYPKYELPYIAKEYLKVSDKLYVTRVLGLSGYNAGPAFIITASNSQENQKKYVVAVLRSRGHYVKYANVGTDCEPNMKYDTLVFDCDKIKLVPPVSVSTIRNGCSVDVTGDTGTLSINVLNYGQFTIEAYKFVGVGEEGADEEGFLKVGNYTVSLNAGSKDYIYDVIGSKATEGSAAVFVEELYDLKLKELVDNGIVDQIDEEPTKANELQIQAVADPVSDFVTIPVESLKRKNLGQSFIAAVEGDLTTGETYNGFGYLKTDENGRITPEYDSAGTLIYETMSVGEIYVVKSFTDKTGKKMYVYVQVKTDNNVAVKVGKIEHDKTGHEPDVVNAVNVLSYDSFVCLNDDEKELVRLNDFSEYHEQFRCASTPWFVSELKGIDVNNLQVKKLFRFHTITDGNDANSQVKVSIANVRPDDGTFDVYIRDFSDSDGNVTILESYKKVNLVPGDSKYLGLQIGTLDGTYEVKSKYVMVEIIEDDMTRTCVPCGFLGYPVRDYSAYNLEAPTFTYNRYLDDDIKVKRQYFGLSDLTGVDVDMLSYKGKNAYTEDYEYGYTHAFHLDSTLSDKVRESLSGVTITVDGDKDTADLVWDAVSIDNRGSEDKSPIIGSEQEMEGTIYEDVNTRKFTAYFFGGFDGWDIYRNSRTNTDEFRANKYKGAIINGHGQTFSKISNGMGLNLEGSAITSDYYAYQAAVNQFEVPERFRINLFATPGIDYVNNTLLVNDVLDMLEEKRQDTFYVVTTPDKPWGSSDAVDDMYSSQDAAENLEDTSIDTYIAATYYPWIKYFDKENNMYINLPASKDVLRNMADVDNKQFPWYAPAGIERGDVDCTKMHFFARLEDEDAVYDGRINPLKTFSKEGVKIWGNKTMYSNDTPMNRINVVRLMLYMKRLITESVMQLIFEPNDTTLVKQFDSIVRPILSQIKNDRGITDFILKESQTPEQMDAHEMSAVVGVKPTPSLEYIYLNFIVAPQGIEWTDITY